MQGEVRPGGRRSPYSVTIPHSGRGRLVAPWVIVLLLCGMAMQSMMVCIDRTQLLGAWHAAARMAQIEIGLHRALHGQGPEERDIGPLLPAASGGSSANKSLLPGLTDLQVTDGSFNQRIGTRRLSGNLSWRLAQPDGNATLFWICGYAAMPAGMTQPQLPNLTDVPPLWLPSSCRNLP
ncbi:MAG: hypothetical protein J0H86_20280 [Xanthomonadaceae bacterium]|nr:hypothetical protein [Xanthomonadaceae bacterium]